MHAQLRRATATLHDALEADLDLLGASLNLSRYAAVLRTFHGYYAGLEPRLLALATRVEPLGFALRARSPLLERDLSALGFPDATTTPPAPSDCLPELSRIEHLAGCLYVIEGAALGGQIIARALERAHGITPAHGSAFFAGDGPNTGARWRAVLHWIDEVVATGANGDEIVSSARATFETLARWARAQGAVA